MFLTAEWRYLAMLNYEVDPGLLLKWVPNGTELDGWNDKVFVSLVGFRFLKTKVLGMPIPFHRNFSEVNLRFYVRRKVGEELRRGVVFIREIVPRWAIATVARTVYNENYMALPMSFHVSSRPSQVKVEYAWRARKGAGKICVSASGDPVLPKQNSEEQFITEHYWGYVKQSDGGTMEYRVEHPSWRVWATERADFTGDAADVYGRKFANILLSKPTSAFIAEGSDIGVRRGTKF